MRLRIFLSTTILLFLIILTSSQLTKAQQSDEPITGPITEPITVPVTETTTPTPMESITPTETPTTTVTPTETPTPTPITNPVPNGKNLIKGRVFYAFFRFFPGLLKVPANNITVEAVDWRSHHKYTDQTDSSGRYEIEAAAGTYTVRPVSHNVFFFLPWEKIVHLSDNESKDHVNFTGYIFHFH